ncbi:MAG TPA: type VI secretion system tip protein TssI/VgrG [Gemmatimonadales bacterium]|nr:type VI secretion system tip protein TssI/VgrG [Gemmatimonadales bacterium]
MPESLSQDGRLLSAEIPSLGADVLLLDSFTGEEGVSQLFQFDVNFVADRSDGSDGKVNIKDILGQPITLNITLAGGDQRCINGIVRRFFKAGVSERLASFRAEVVPKVWLLSLQSKCRIFQGKTLPEIIEAVLKENSITFKMSLMGKYTPVDYCVQYRETSLNFICRLMEEAGIYYWFDHDDGDHTMILADAASAHKDCPSESKFNLDTSTGSTDEDFISEWSERTELATAGWTIRDVHLELLGSLPEVDTVSTADIKPPDGIEMYDYPGGFAKRFNKTGERLGDVHDEGSALVSLMQEEADAGLIVVDGESNCRAMIPGFKMSVDSRSLQQISGNYILTNVRHAARQSPTYTGADVHGGAYHNDFSCVPVDTILRPPRETPKPAIHGLQYAKVIDEGDPQSPKEEIAPDKFGRVRLLFPWDDEAKYACWVPVSQARAGLAWGQVWIPRVGDYVVVAFMEGDPDCPVVVGSLWNGKFPPPYALPANKTQSGIKTRSTPKGGTDDYNELRFEDKKGSEEIHVQAQKDLNVLIKNDETRTIGNERKVTVKKDESLHVEEGDMRTGVMKGNWYRGVKKDMLTTVEEGDLEMTVKLGHALEEIEMGDSTLNVKQGNLAVMVGQGNHDTKIDMGNRSTKLGMGNDALKLDMGNLDIKLGVGNATIKCDVGKVTIEALQGIELKCGTSSIKIDMMGVTIKGMMVQAEGQIQTQIKGLMASVKGDAMLQAGGAITMIG